MNDKNFVVLHYGRNFRKTFDQFRAILERAIEGGYSNISMIDGTSEELNHYKLSQDELLEALKKIKDHCVCERFSTKGFDYGEKHKHLGKSDSGSRWLTPYDIADKAIIKCEGVK